MGYALHRKCSITGCSKKHYGLGKCAMHYFRFRKWGDVNITKRKSPGLGSIRSDGYRLITVNGNRVYEHRYVMEQKLQRTLKHNETVHHLDGNKLNNAPDNLELYDNISTHRKLHHSLKGNCWKCVHKSIFSTIECRNHTHNARWCKFRAFAYSSKKCNHGKFEQNRSFSYATSNSL